ncbi:MAG: NAD(P)-dependent oxidoreductase [Candidatus Omnitrophica bacterium]|nr:NAD(P)-dependent oxidoreductase [Candidatus Omnitrophota bacterium]
MNSHRIVITGGTGFLGMALARYFLDNGWQVALLDESPLADETLKGHVEMFRGDVRDLSLLRQSIREGDVVVHAAAALPIRGSKELIFDVNVNGTRKVLTAAKRNRAEKVIFISSTAVYGVPKVHPTTENHPLDPMGHYGVSKTMAETVCEEFREQGYPVAVLRPKTFLGPGRLGIFQILFEWIHQGNLVYILGKGANRYQLLALSDLLEAIWKTANLPLFSQTLNIGSEVFGAVREELEDLIQHAHSSARLFPLPAAPIKGFLRFLELCRLSPLVEWHYKTACEDSYVAIEKAKQTLDWFPRKSNIQALRESYDEYSLHRDRYLSATGQTHTVAWDPKLLRVFRIPAKWIP